MKNKNRKLKIKFFTDAIGIYEDGDEDKEIAYWTRGEWERDSEVVFSIANAIRLVYENPEKQGGKILTKKQKRQLWRAGNNDGYVNETLCENANEFVVNTLKINPEDKNYQEAIEIYCNGFYGDKKEGEKK